MVGQVELLFRQKSIRITEMFNGNQPVVPHVHGQGVDGIESFYSHQSQQGRKPQKHEKGNRHFFSNAYIIQTINEIHNQFLLSNSSTCCSAEQIDRVSTRLEIGLCLINPTFYTA